MLNPFDWGLQEAGYCCGGVRVLMQNGLQRLGEASPVRLQGCSAPSSPSECSLHLIRLDPALNTSLLCFRTFRGRLPLRWFITSSAEEKDFTSSREDFFIPSCYPDWASQNCSAKISEPPSAKQTVPTGIPIRTVEAGEPSRPF